MKSLLKVSNVMVILLMLANIVLMLTSDDRVIASKFVLTTFILATIHYSIAYSYNKKYNIEYTLSKLDIILMYSLSISLVLFGVYVYYFTPYSSKISSLVPASLIVAGLTPAIHFYYKQKKKKQIN